MGVVDCVIHDRVMVVRLAGRGANAMNIEMAETLAGLAREAAARRDVGAVLVTGGYGTAFCAGSDIGELARLRDCGGPGPLLEAEAAAFAAVAALDLPTLAAVEGAAMGGGLELALCCDLIVASEGARFGLPEVGLGVFPALGGTVRLQRRIGEGRAREMLLLGGEIDGATAVSWGLANRLTPAGMAYHEARALARRLARGPREAMAGIKGALREAAVLPEAEALARALAAALAHAASADAEEGLRAFMAKDEPDFLRRRG